MNFEELLRFFPAIEVLMAKLRESKPVSRKMAMAKRYSLLEEKSGIVTQICDELDNWHDVINKDRESQQAVFAAAELLKNRTVEFQKTKQLRPMDLTASPQKTQKWAYDLVEEQKLKDAQIQLNGLLEQMAKNKTIERTKQQLEAWKTITRYANDVMRDLNEAYNVFLQDLVKGANAYFAETGQKIRVKFSR